MNIFKWIENIWNLRLIFDKYLPKIREIVETIRILKEQIESLRAAKIEIEKELKQLTVAEQKSVEDAKNVVVDKYYDPQLGVEYVDVKIDEEKASPEDDTVVDK